MSHNPSSGGEYIDIEAEIEVLQNLFPTISRAEFYYVETGTIGAKLRYIPTSSEHDVFDVLMEYPQSYPNDPPRMWVTDPQIDPDSGMVLDFDHRNDALVNYIDRDQWDPSMNGFHAATMMKSWIASYCQWLEGEEQPERVEEALSELSLTIERYRRR